MKSRRAPTSFRSRAVTLAIFAAACLSSAATTAHARPPCSEAGLERYKQDFRSAHDRWGSSYSAADHSAFDGARTALVDYATSCLSTLGGDLPKLLAGTVNIPFADTLSSAGPRAPGDEVDLVIYRVPTTNSGTAGTTLNYNYLISNNGATATNPQMSATLIAEEVPAPALTVFTVTPDADFASDGCAITSVSGSIRSFTCGLGENLPSQFPSLIWSIGVELGTNENIDIGDSGDVYAEEFELSNGNNRTSGSIRFTASSGLSITATGPAGIIAGNNISYTLSVANNGPSLAEGVVIKDFVAPEVDLTSFSISSGSCSNSPGTQTVTCNAGNMALAAVRTVTINGKVKANVPDGTVIFNDSQVSSNVTADPNTGDNIDSVATTVDAGTSGLSVVQTGPASATAGTDVTYTATITNVGDEPATNAVFRPFAPAEMEIVAFTVSAGDCNVNAPNGPSCNLGTIGAGLSRIATVTQHIRTSTPDTTILFHTAQASSDAFESSNGDNVDTDPTTVTGATSGLVVAKVGPPTVVAGTQIDYSFSVTNVGPDPASSVVLKDVVPTEIDVTGFSSSQGSCGLSLGTVTCNLGSLAENGGAATGTLSGIVKANVLQGTVVLNTASATGSIFESDTGDNASTASTTVDAQADLGVVVTDSKDPVNLMTPFRWNLTVTNAGPSDAQMVSLTQTLPKNVEDFQFRELPPQCDRFKDIMKCSLGTVKAGAVFDMYVELEASPDSGASFVTSATVGSVTTDPNATNNTEDETTSMTAPDLTGSFTSISSQCSAIAQTCNVNGKFKVTNVGNAKSVQTSLRFVRSANTTYGTGDPQLKKFTINQLKPNVAQEVSFLFIIPINWYVIAEVDNGNKEHELVEANNVFYKGPFPKP